MLQLFTVFHLNLAYSSIEEEQRGHVIRACYWPLLRLAERHRVPIGIEASAYTLAEVAAIDPSWLVALRRLVAAGICEFVGSGYVQMIGPLIPAEINAANLRLGHATYERLLGFRPTLAYVNEQAYSAGLIQHYLDAGYEAIVMEWENPARYRVEWDPEWRYFPQLACGHHGEVIPVIWNNAVAFQHFQRFAYGESDLDEYMAYLASHHGGTSRSLPLYGNDVEVFDYRPGRYTTEPPLAEDGEWARIEGLFDAIREDGRFAMIRPSDVLSQLRSVDGGHRLHLESAAQPTPVKKQRKYNVTRWAVTGRNDLGINTACWRIWRALRQGERSDDEWRTVCELWSSDYRTHITDQRWTAYNQRLATVEHSVVPPAQPSSLQREHGDHAERAQVTRRGMWLTVETPRVRLILNCRRGLAIEGLWFLQLSPSRLFGTIKHGYYDDIGWGADFFSGLVVLESPGRPKMTDLVPVEPDVTVTDDGGATIRGIVQTELGNIEKHFTITPEGHLLLEYRFHWPEIPLGSLRFGDITLDPETFDERTVFYRTHNGGYQPETFYLRGTTVDHTEPVSFLVSASHAIGMTEGSVEIGDATRSIVVKVDKTTASVVGMITHRAVRDRYFTRLKFSAAELDETRRVFVLTRDSPLVCRFVLSPQKSQ